LSVSILAAHAGRRLGLRCESGCETRRGALSDAPLQFIRASGDCSCSCGKLYYDHPYCAASYAGDEHDGVYVLHVLCDGTHVKL
jgi:hypothetical protein